MRVIECVTVVSERESRLLHSVLHLCLHREHPVVAHVTTSALCLIVMVATITSNVSTLAHLRRSVRTRGVVR